jgi:TRAP-type uncharacterized transport system fused permease subunit
MIAALISTTVAEAIRKRMRSSVKPNIAYALLGGSARKHGRHATYEYRTTVYVYVMSSPSVALLGTTGRATIPTMKRMVR